MYKFCCSYCGGISLQSEDIAPQCKGETSRFGTHELRHMLPYDREDKRGSLKHPTQPLENDGNCVLRFKENKIVRYLLDNGGISLNKIAMLNFPQEDEEQFAQLIGYSLSGFGSLSYVSDETYEAAAKSALDASDRISKLIDETQKGTQ